MTCKEMACFLNSTALVSLLDRVESTNFVTMDGKFLLDIFATCTHTVCIKMEKARCTK